MKNLKSLLQVSDLSAEDIGNILDLSSRYVLSEVEDRVLAGKVIANLFFESSTRTLLSFEIAAKALGAISITLNTGTSSINKGEGIVDTLSTIGAMGVDLLVIRSGINGLINNEISRASNYSIVNAGDGSNEHPTQALTDYATICHLVGTRNISGLNITICGDVFHSRVARSNIRLLSRYGANLTVVTPPCSPLWRLEGISKLTHDMEDGIKDADVIMLLRIQKERIDEDFISESEYSKFYMLNKDRLSCARDGVIVMHPGPMNRGIEISDEVADASKAILLQVKMGVAVRKAILHYILA